MRKTFFLFAIMLFVSFSCITGQAKLGQEYQVDGTDVFCAEEFSVAPGEVKAKARCSFTAEKDGVIYSCKNIELSNLNKDFKFDVSCEVVIDKNKKAEVGEDTVLIEDKALDSLATINTVPNYLENKDNEPEDHG